MTRKYLSYLFAALLAVSLPGCKADLNELDTTAGLNVGLSMPVGTFTLAMNDLLGKDAPNLVVDENGMYHILDTTIVAPKKFHPINLADYIILTEGGKQFKVLDQISDKINPAWLSAGVIISPIDTIIPLTFDMSMKLQGFNEDINSERIDSILVALASFMSTVDHSSDFTISWDNISAITLRLGNRIVRHQVPSNDVEIGPLPSYDFGQQIPINISDFTINLIDPAAPIGLVDSVMISIQFDLKLRRLQPVSITADSYFFYDLRINILDYEAMWGFFKEDREMVDQNVIVMDSLWNQWSEVKNMKMRFAQPSLWFFMTHRIGAPLKTHIDYMYSINKEEGVRHYAHWNNQQETDIQINPVLDPLVQRDLNDSVEIALTFSYKDSEGDIEKLFYTIPDSFAYKYHIMVDESRKDRYPQHRMTRNMDFHLAQILDLPFYFESGTNFTCTQEMEGLKLSSLQLDSMLKQANFEAKTTRNDLTLYLAAENYVPFEVDITMECLDKDGNPVDVSFFEGDTLRILPPAAADMVDGVAVKPALSSSTRVLHKQEFDKMAKVEKVRLVANMGKNDSPAKLTKDTHLTIKIGVTAEVEGTINLEKLFK